MKKLYYLTILSLLCNACGCPNPKNMDFAENDTQWLIYKPNQVFNYYNQRGEKLSYIVSTIKDSIDFQHNAPPAVFFPVCTQAYNMPVKKVVLTNQLDSKDKITFYWIKKFLADTNTMPLYAWSVWEGKNFHAYIQSSDFDTKFNQNFDTLKISNYNNPNSLYYEFLIKKHTSIRGKVYENVLFSKQKDLNTNFSFYYHKTQGIIRFETANGTFGKLSRKFWLHFDIFWGIFYFAVCILTNDFLLFTYASN